MACDVRDYYRELLEDGVDDAAASQLTVEKFAASLQEPDGVALRLLRSRNQSSVVSTLTSAIGRWRCSIAVPSRETLERLGPKVDDPVALVNPRSPDTRFFAFGMKRIDWRGAGFSKVQTIGTRAGDDQTPVPDCGISAR